MARKSKAPSTGLALRPGQMPDTRRLPMQDRKVIELSTQAKMRRRAFVMEYLRSFNVQTAYFATGYKGKPHYASIKGGVMLREPFVQALLYKLVRQMDEKELISRGEVIAGLKREANYMEDGTTHSARVAAWAKLGLILDMGKENSKGGVVVQAQGNVMLVPMTGSEGSWEEMAAAQQSHLKRVVKGEEGSKE